MSWRIFIGVSPGGFWRRLLALALMGGSFAARANDFTKSFDAANQLYVEGRFADAAAAYEGMLQTGNISEAILFNRGNALFREGKTGLAIASYREAQVLAPRDRDLRANLQFARTRPAAARHITPVGGKGGWIP